nr:MAG TPA: hypothetical protein [Caudoviricetes sp.]
MGKVNKQVRRIRKVKADKHGKIIIDWEVYVRGNWDEYHMKCSDLPRPEFYSALMNLRQDVLTLLEYPENWLDKITVRGVSYSYSDDGVEGAVITAQRDLEYSTAPENCNTPHKPYEMYNEDGEDPEGIILMPPEIIDRLDVLEDEAQKYIDGDRAQGTLDFDGADEEKHDAEGSGEDDSGMGK